MIRWNRIAALAAISSLLFGAGYAAVTITSSQTIKIQEALVITPSSFSLSIYPGESAILNYTVTDLSRSPVPVTVGASISPSSSDATLGIPGGTSQTMKPGSQVIQILLSLDTSAPGGTYSVALNLSR